jgi:hypothetical protein
MMRGGAVYDDGMLRIIWVGSPPVLAIAGEIDESTYPGLVGALKEVADGTDDVHISLAGVDYCDLAGLRAIVLLTGTDGPGYHADGHDYHADGQSRDGERPGQVGGDRQARRVVLHDVPPQLQAVLRIVGWDSAPGLALMDGYQASVHSGDAAKAVHTGGCG